MTQAEAIKVVRLLAAALSGYADMREHGLVVPAHLTPSPEQYAKGLTQAIGVLQHG